MVWRAFSWLTQKLACPIWSVSRARRVSLLGTSKTVPQLGKTAEHLARSASQVDVHGTSWGQVPAPLVGASFSKHSKTRAPRTIRVRPRGLTPAAVRPSIPEIL